MRACMIGLLVGLTLAAASARGGALDGITNYHEYSPALSSSGQPTRRQFEVIAAAGFGLVVNLSPKNLPDSIEDERRLVEQTGMRYAHIPVNWDQPSLDDLQGFLEVMDAARGERVLVHCWLNSRSSAFVYLYRTLRDGQPEGAEHQALVTLWDRNQGYELSNVPRWREFIVRAKARFQ